MLNALELTGRARTHIVQRPDLDNALHYEVVEPFLAMKSHAALDYAAIPAGYRVSLTPEEVAPSGIFFHLHQWLDANMARFGFFRPFRSQRGGVQPEPWHISYAPVSTIALEMLTPELIASTVSASNMLGKEQVLERIADFYLRYVVNIDPPDFPVWRA